MAFAVQLSFNQKPWWCVFLSISVAGWRVLTVAATGRANRRFQAWCSWRALVCARGFRWCYLSQALLTPCLHIFLASSTHLWRHSRTISRGCKADSLSPRHQEDTCILIYIRIEEGSDLVPWSVNAGAPQLTEASTYERFPKAGEYFSADFFSCVENYRHSSSTIFVKRKWKDIEGWYLQLGLFCYLGLVSNGKNSE